MNVKLGQIVEAAQSLDEFKSVRMPAKIAYRMSVASDRILRHARRAEEIRGDLVKRFGEETEDGNYLVPKEKVDEFYVELNALYDEDVELNLAPIDAEKMGDELMVSPLAMLKLGFLWETGPLPLEQGR